MCPSISVPSDGMIPEVPAAQVQSTRGPPRARPGDPAEAPAELDRDDGIAAVMNDTVVHRLFSAGLSLQTALGLLGNDYAVARQVGDAVGELELAIRDIRTALFDDPVMPGTAIPPELPAGREAAG